MLMLTQGGTRRNYSSSGHGSQRAEAVGVNLNGEKRDRQGHQDDEELGGISDETRGQTDPWQQQQRSKDTRKTHRNGCRHVWKLHCSQLVLAFLLGIVSAYIVLGFNSGSLRLGAPSFIVQKHTQFPQKRCTQHSLEDLGLPPMALQALTGKPNVTVDRLIVAARHHEDTSWLDSYLSEIPHVVYQIDDPAKTEGAQHASIANKGNEAIAYLQFIIDYYHQLPDATVFIHGHRSAWHMLDVVPVLQRLRWVGLGYAPLRYKNSPGDRLDWQCGSRTEDPIWKQFDCDWEGSPLRPGNMTLRDAKDVNEVSKDWYLDSLEVAQAWPQLFQQELGDLPAEMHSPCCSTFMVTRDRILRHDVSFYKHIRDWIIRGAAEEKLQLDSNKIVTCRTEMSSYRAGRIIEYTWHIIFGEAPVMAAVPECALLECDEP